MAKNNSASFNLNINTKTDLAGINQLKTALNEIKTAASSADSLLDSDKSKILRVHTAANDLERALTSAFNPKLNTFSIDKFNQSLIKSGTTLEQVQMDLSLMGVQGEQAFLSMTSQLLRMNPVIKQTNGFIDKLSKTFFNSLRYQTMNMAINKMASSISQAYGYVKNLDKSLNSIQIVTEKNADSMREFAKQANEAAKALGTGTTDYTDSSLIFYQQGELKFFIGCIA